MPNASSIAKRRAAKALVRDTLTAIACIALFALLVWAAARGLDSEGACWAVGDYGAPVESVEEVEP